MSVLKLFRSSIFWAPFIAWFVAQFTKMLCGLTKKRMVDFSYLVSSGGMPSAHSSMVAGLATAIGIRAGFGAPVFVLSLAFAFVTMFDAATVRQAAGRQAKLVNDIVDEVFKERHFPEQKLAELLGHTRLEVFMGVVMGILVAMFITSVAGLP